MRFIINKIRPILLACATFLGTSIGTLAEAAPDVWEVLISQFALNHEVSRPEVQAQIRWLVAHPGYVQKVCQQSEPYIYHIAHEIKKRGLPGELALLPMIESSYDPFAYSGVGAAGLWQIMPKTGSELGLKQDWWFDARRSIGASTNAALNYLVYLRDFFNGNWTLAIASYDAGEGRISSAIKMAQTGYRGVDFWSLSIPRETSLYVPRFLALAEVIKNHERYHIQLPYIPYVPYFEEINIGSQIDLNRAASLAGISYKELIKLNPGFNRWTTSPDQSAHLLIPRHKVERFTRNLANLTPDKLASWSKHIVLPGETLQQIANRYHTTVTLIKKLNQLKQDQLKPNQSILIPNAKNTKAIASDGKIQPMPVIVPMTKPSIHRVIHIVQPKDTMHKLEQLYRVTANDLRKWNKLPEKSAIKPGQTLVIWEQIRAPMQYTVQPGDSLNKIAHKNNTRVNNILALNPGLNRTQPLKAGQRILVG